MRREPEGRHVRTPGEQNMAGGPPAWHGNKDQLLVWLGTAVNTPRPGLPLKPPMLTPQRRSVLDDSLVQCTLIVTVVVSREDNVYRCLVQALHWLPSFVNCENTFCLVPMRNNVPQTPMNWVPSFNWKPKTLYCVKLDKNDTHTILWESKLLWLCTIEAEHNQFVKCKTYQESRQY